MSRLIVVLNTLLLVLILVSCTSNIAGTGSQAGNGVIAGVAVGGDGMGLSFVKVKLVPSNYNPIADDGDIRVDITDSSGHYHFDSLSSGTYTVQLENRDSLGFIHKLITVTDEPTDTLIDTVRELGVIKIILPSNLDTSKGYVYVEGTDIYRVVNSKEIYIDSIPAGSTPRLIYYNTDTVDILIDSLSVLPKDTIIQSRFLFVTEFDFSYGETVVDTITTYLKEWGIDTKVITSSKILLSDTIGVEGVIFSPVIGDVANFITAINGTALPIITMEPFILRYLNMTDTTTDVDYGVVKDQTTLEIVDNNNPISGNLTGIVKLFSDTANIEWGKPLNSAIKVATIVGDTLKSNIFTYAVGDTLVNEKVTLGKRAGFLVSGSTIERANSNLWYLFHNTINWILNPN